jgi:hypothetical protein
MSTEKPVCDCCGKTLVGDTIVVVVHADDAQIVRHRECHFLELLERA